MAIQKWSGAKPLTNPIAIQQLEQQYGFSISKELADCILAHNGARPEPNSIVLRNGEQTDVKILLSYNKNDPENIYKVIDYFIGHFHGKLIPFASDSSGNYYCEQGKRIVLWTQNNEIL
ncbi:MAG: SMI1/KNR4 family protein, partial [Candidatus Spyradocola sp.]